MLFRKIALIPYGTYNGKDRVFKVFFKGKSNDLFLQGYYVIGENTEVIVSTKLNELFDYSAVDTTDKNKNFITDKNGAFNISLVNDSVPGYSKVLETTISIDFIKIKNETTIVPEDSVAYEVIKSQLSSLHKVKPALAEYISLISYIEYKSDFKSKEKYLPKIEEYPKLSILKYYKTVPFLSLLSDDKNITGKLLKMFPTKIPLNISNLSKFITLLEELKKDDTIKLNNISMFDIKYGIRLLSSGVAVKSAIFMIKEALQPETKSIILDFTKNKEELFNEFKDVVLNFYRINYVEVKKGTEIIANQSVIPIYVDNYLPRLNNEKLFFLSDKNLMVSLNFNIPSIMYTTDKNEFTSKTALNSDFETINADNIQISLTFYNKQQGE